MKRPIAAVAAFAVLLALAVGGADAAYADAVGLTLTTVSDDTSPLAGDTSATNAVVPSAGGAVTYQWGWSNPGATTATFSQTLPPGMLWGTESVAAGCTRTGTVTTGQNLTCSISGLTVGARGSINKVARVYNVTNGTTLSSTLTSGSQTSSPVVVTAASKPTVGLSFATPSLSFSDALDPQAPNTAAGIKVPYTFALWVDRSTAVGANGAESLNGPITVPVTVPAGYKLFGCSTDVDIRSEVLPTPATTASTDAASVANSGSLACAQSGTTVTLTLTGTDTSFVRFPTLYKNGATIAASAPGYFAVGGFYLWKPLADFPVGTAVTIPVSSSGAQVTGKSGRAATSAAAGGTATVTRAALSLSLSSSSISVGTAYQGQNYLHTVRLVAPTGTGVAMTGVTVCETWDPSLVTVRNAGLTATGVTNISPALNAATDLSVEYGTVAYANESARQNADCGAVGDASPAWYTSISAAAAGPGGLNAVTAVRFKYKRSFKPGETMDISVPMAASTNPALAVNTKLPFYTIRWSDQTARVSSTFTSASGTANVTGAQVPLSTAKVSLTSAFGATDVKTGTAASVSVQPLVTSPVIANGQDAQAVKVTTTLPDGCFTFVPGTPAPASVTPATPATPTGAQTCRDIAGQVVVWNLGNVPTSSSVAKPPLTFTLNLAPGAPAPYTATITSVIQSTSDLAAVNLRTASSSINTTSVAELLITKTATASSATPGVPVTYRLGWKNGTAGSLGQAWVVDVLPNNADGRGTTGLTSLAVGSVVTNPAGLTVQYTTQSTGTVIAALGQDSSGSTGITWTTTAPSSGITALRVRTPTLTADTTGYADVTVTPGALAAGGRLVNTVTAKPDGQSTPTNAASAVTLASSSSTVTGAVFTDVDYSGARSTGDTAIVGSAVALTGYGFGANAIDDSGTGDDVAVSTSAVTSSTGDYSFVASPGRYSVAVTSGTTGKTVVVQPSVPFEVAASSTNAGKDFLYQTTLRSPTAVADTAKVSQGRSVAVNVTANDDTAPPASGPASTVTIASGPSKGTVSLVGTTVTYAANATWPGTITASTYTDTFTYTLRNAQGKTDTATVTVTVYHVPVATADAANVSSTATTDVPVLGNDIGDALTLTSASTGGAGTVTVTGTSIRFRPAARTWATGESSYTEVVQYRITDSQGLTADGTLTLTVVRPPTAIADAVTIAYGATVTVDVLANDTVNAPPGTISISSPPAQGTATVVSGQVRFVPASGQTGIATVGYTVTDAVGQQASSALRVTIAQPLVATDDGSAAVPLRAASGPTTIAVLINDSGSSVAITSVTQPASGAVTFTASTVTFTPPAGFSGRVSFTYTITDVSGATATATVYLQVVTDPLPDQVTVAQGQSVVFDVLANDGASATGATFSRAQVAPTPTLIGGAAGPVPGSPAYGDVTCVETGAGRGSCTYRPAAGFTGIDGFDYALALDSTAWNVHVTVTVTAVDAAPIARADRMVAETGGAEVRITPLDNDADPEQTPLRIVTAVLSTPGHGTFSCTATDCGFRPAADGWTGQLSVDYTIADGAGIRAASTIAVFVDPAPLSARGFTDGAIAQQPVATAAWSATSTVSVTASCVSGRPVAAVSWSAVTDATNWVIERRLSGSPVGAWVRVADAAAGATSFTDGRVGEGRSYQWRVRPDLYLWAGGFSTASPAAAMPAARDARGC